MFAFIRNEGLNFNLFETSKELKKFIYIETYIIYIYHCFQQMKANIGMNKFMDIFDI